MGYERKKITRMMKNGRRNRLLDGYRPFGKLPLGYRRKRLSEKEYIDFVDPEKGHIVKSGLELYANDILPTHTDLRKYRDEKGLKANGNNSTTLYRSFVAKLLQLHRIIFYAGYIIYPDRGIDEPIKGKHEGLISLDTAYRIIEKQQKINGNTNKKKVKCLKMSDEHPLRGVITCPFCERKFTSRNTRKYRVKNGNKVCTSYPYYCLLYTSPSPRDY